MAKLVQERWDMPAEPGAGGHDYYEYGPHELGADFLRGALQINPLEEISDFDGPVLVVHGDDDESVPPEHAQQYIDAIGRDDASLEIIDGADHTYSQVALERKVISTTEAFLINNL
jgi:hypothetical protein